MENKRTLVSLFGTLVGALVLSGLVTALTWARPQQQSCPCSADGAAEGPIVALRVPSLTVVNADMAEALEALRSQDVGHIVIGFEQVPHAEGEKGPPISLVFANATVPQIIQLFCQADPRYECQVIKGLIIDVRPKGAGSSPNDLLNIKVRDYNIDASVTADQAIRRIDEDAPELRDFLRQRHEEWMKRTGRQPGGSPGSIWSGNFVPPRFTLHLHDATVRQILDAISLKDIESFNQGPKYNALGMPTRGAPTGWEYDFILKPNASTGLGGYPTWRSF